VITDLHLVPLGDERSEAFITWCDALVDVPALVCLGDLFSVWVGRKQARIPGTKAVFDAFARLAERGIHVHLVPGNRDAILDEAFASETGGAFHLEGFVGLLGDLDGNLDGGERATFVHGDALCTLDRRYLQLRRLLRRRPLRFATRHGPFWLARWIGSRIRGASESAKPCKLPEEKSIRVAAVRALAAATSVSAVVCGHAHVLRDEVLAGGDGATPVRWIVIGEWESEGDLLRIGADGGLELMSSATIPQSKPT
jgi:UDP-2,3-diacylglucosamine hydrolase